MHSRLTKRKPARSHNRAVTTTANRIAESTEEAIVYAHDFDVRATAMLLDNGPAVMLLGVQCEDVAYSTLENLKNAVIIIKKGRWFWCETDKDVAAVAVTEERSVPNVVASGDRIHEHSRELTPGVRSSEIPNSIQPLGSGLPESRPTQSTLK